MNKTALAALFAAMSFATSTASARLITFYDLADNGGGTAIGNGYSGLDWDNFNVLNTASLVPSGFVNGTVSTSNVAYNDQASPATITSPAGFNLIGAQFTGAWNNGLQIEALAFSDTDTFTKDFTVDSTGPTNVVFNWNNITYVTFSSLGGANGGYGSSGDQFVIDNLNVASAVPEPDVWGLMMTGIPLAFRQIRSRLK
jgi:hypothetical protein